MAKLVVSGGVLCVEVPSTVFTPPLAAGAKYDVAASGATIVASFGAKGASSLIQFGLAASSAGTAKAQTSCFGVDVDKEAQQLGWKAGRTVTMSMSGTTLTFA